LNCQHCGHRYPANLSATYPGGFEATGVFLWTTILFGAGTGLAFCFQWRLGFWIGCAATVLAAIQIFVCWSSCHGAGGFSSTGGETCPKCEGKNRIYPWSF